jgi:hypothetical protein
MTLEQYKSIYERERKKSSSVPDAAYIIFKALNREIAYRVEHNKSDLFQALNYANAVWEALASNYSELRLDGFKNMTALYAEKSDDSQIKSEIFRLIELL